MAGSRGIDNWNKNWRGRGNVPTVVKTSSGAPYYEQQNSVSTVGRIPRGTQVVYIDNISRVHNKVAVQYNGQTVYTNIDNLAKPRSISVVNLKPQAFGLAGTEYTLSGYITALKNSIRSRSDIQGDLQEYLLDLVEFADTNSSNISGYDINDLPIRDIIKDFGEVIGPIYCIRRGLSRYNVGVNITSKIFIPVAPNEPLLDYYIIAGSNRIKVSAKARGTSNTLKVADLVPVILGNPTLLRKYGNSIEFNTMRQIYDNTMIQGPIKACGVLGIITQEAVNSVASNPADVPDTSLFTNLIQSDVRLQNSSQVTTRQVSFLCEKALIDYSKKETIKYTEIVREVLKNEIYFVKLDINGGIPSFMTQSTSGDTSISNLYFRTKNGYDAKSDKLGFKL
jgi:hypothetical protein